MAVWWWLGALRLAAALAAFLIEVRIATRTLRIGIDATHRTDEGRGAGP